MAMHEFERAVSVFAGNQRRAPGADRFAEIAELALERRRAESPWDPRRRTSLRWSTGAGSPLIVLHVPRGQLVARDDRRALAFRGSPSRSV